MLTVKLHKGRAVVGKVKAAQPVRSAPAKVAQLLGVAGARRGQEHGMHQGRQLCGDIIGTRHVVFANLNMPAATPCAAIKHRTKAVFAGPIEFKMGKVATVQRADHLHHMRVGSDPFDIGAVLVKAAVFLKKSATRGSFCQRWKVGRTIDPTTGYSGDTAAPRVWRRARGDGHAAGLPPSSGSG